MSCRWKTLMSLLVAVLVLTAGSGVAFGQVCGGSLTPTISPVFAQPGDNVRITLTMGLTGTNPRVIPATDTAVADAGVRFALDCAGDGFIPCANEGNIVSFVGVVSTTCGVTWTAQSCDVATEDCPADVGLDSNVIQFTPSAAVDLSVINTCDLVFDVTLNSVGTDSDPDLVTGAAQFDGTCSSLVGGGQASVAIPVPICEVEVDKQVSCDGGATWYSFDFGGSGNAQDFCSGFIADGGPADQIQFRFWARRSPDTSENVVLQDCVLTDPDLTAKGYTPPSASLIDLSGLSAVEIGSTGAQDCTAELDDLEPNTATLTCDCAIDEVVFDTATDTDDASFSCDTCDVEISKTVSCEHLDGPTPFGEECTGFNAFPGHEAQDVTVRYEITNTGQVGLNCVPSGGFPGDGLTDNNPELNPTQNQGDIAAGDTVTVDVTNPCSDALAASEPDTGTIACFCRDAGGNLTDRHVTASDGANFFCKDPGLQVTKACDPQVEGSNAVLINVSNQGDTQLANCHVTDEYFPTDPTCSEGEEEGTPTSLTVAPNDFALAIGQDVDVTGSISGLTSQACNTVSVTCEVVGSGGKTITDEAENECEVGGDCLTRTPGFWGTHPLITDDFLPLTNCGINITTVDVPGGEASAIEDMCSVGTDAKTLEYYPQQIQLERQCMAALLNVAATDEVFNSSCDTAYPGTTEMIEECCTNLDSVCVLGQVPGTENTDGRTHGDCIEDLDAFNNNDAAEPDVTGTVFESPGPADPSYCQDAKNNGNVNDPRTRAANVKPAGGQKK